MVRQRLARAEALIVTSEKTMAEIANEVGYSSASYLIRKFREAYGMPPTQYRSQYENAMIRSEKM